MFHINMGGDAEHGWMGEVHDGDQLTTYNPQGRNLSDALHNMLHKHFGTENAPPDAIDTAPAGSTASTTAEEAAAKQAAYEKQRAQYDAQARIQAALAKADAGAAKPAT